MKRSRFIEKLNKVDGNVYVIEELVQITDGVYEGELQHDNVNTATFAAYTGPKLTGNRIESYVLSTPSMTPWKKVIRVYADVPEVYLSYETEGDTVEAEDVNRVQDAVVETQDALNIEAERAATAEAGLAQRMEAEKERAVGAEEALQGQLDDEISRAQARESEISSELAGESARAQNAEKVLSDHLSAEITRAKAAETANCDAIAAETGRAEARERELQGNIDAHTADVDGEIQSLRAADTALDEKKADAADVNRELGYRYTKSQVFTKEEVLRKIQDLIGTAPDTLDTFKEIADALGNDPNFAATIMNALAGKVDKVTGKQLTSNDYSDSEKAIVADVNEKKHTHGNKSVIDKITQALLDHWSAAYAHVSDAVKHITGAERESWNTVTNKVDKVAGKQLSTNDYTTAEKSKLAGIAAGAEVNVQPDWSVTDAASDAFIKSKPTSLPANGGTASKLSNAIDVQDFDTFVPPNMGRGAIRPVIGSAESNSPWGNSNGGYLIQTCNTDCWHLILFRSGEGGWAYRSYYEEKWSDWRIWSTFDGAYDSLSGKPTAFPPSAHTHTKSQISDMPTKLSQFTNDPGYITQADVDVSQNHTHANKTVLDKVTQALLDKWNSALTALPSHTHTKAQITDFPASLKNPNALSVSLNGVLQEAYDGSAAKSYDITAASVGAATATHTHKYLPLSGGTMTGNLNLRQGFNIFSSSAGAGLPGYVLMAQINIGGGYTDCPIVFEFANRGAQKTTIVTLLFASTSSNDPTISRFDYYGKNIGVYIRKFEAGKWNLYIKKSAAYDNIVVYKVSRNYDYANMSNVEILWKGTFSETLPDGSLEASFSLDASSSVKLKTSRKIGNIYFDGTTDITLNEMGAAASNHNHDSIYLKKEAVTWNDLKGGA